MDKETICTIRYEGAGRIFYVAVNEMTGETWLDIKYLPVECFLYAACDGISMYEIKVGKKKKEQRDFLPLKWLAFDWGTDKELEKALQEKYYHYKDNWKEIVHADKETFKKLTSC